MRSWGLINQRPRDGGQTIDSWSQRSLDCSLRGVASDQWPACPGSEAIITSIITRSHFYIGSRKPWNPDSIFHSQPLYSHVPHRPHPTRRWGPVSGVWVSRIARVKWKTIQTLNIRRISFIFWFTPLCLCSPYSPWGFSDRVTIGHSVRFPMRARYLDVSRAPPTRLTHTCALLDWKSYLVTTY